MIDVQVNLGSDFIVGLGHQGLAHDFVLELPHILVHKDNVALEGILVEGHELDRNELLLTFANLDKVFDGEKSPRELLFQLILLVKALFGAFFPQRPSALRVRFGGFLGRHIRDNNFIIGIQVLEDIFHFDVDFFALVEGCRAVPGANGFSFRNFGF